MSNLLLGEAEIVRWRVDRLRCENLDQDDFSDGVLRTSFPVEGEQLVVEGTGFDNRGDALEAVALADKRIDDVHFHVGVASQVRESARRSDVGEDEMIVVPDRRCSL